MLDFIPLLYQSYVGTFATECTQVNTCHGTLLYVCITNCNCVEKQGWFSLCKTNWKHIWLDPYDANLRNDDSISKQWCASIRLSLNTILRVEMLGSDKVIESTEAVFSEQSIPIFFQYSVLMCFNEKKPLKSPAGLWEWLHWPFLVSFAGSRDHKSIVLKCAKWCNWTWSGLKWRRTEGVCL